MHERSLVSVKVETRSTSRLSSALFSLPPFYLHDYHFRALTCVAKNVSVEINLWGAKRIARPKKTPALQLRTCACRQRLFLKKMRKKYL